MKATLKADGYTLTLSSEPPDGVKPSLMAFAYVAITPPLNVDGRVTFPLDTDGAGALVGALFGLIAGAARNPFR